MSLLLCTPAPGTSGTGVLVWRGKTLIPWLSSPLNGHYSERATLPPSQITEDSEFQATVFENQNIFKSKPFSV